MKSIINLTQHHATDEQVAAGVVDLEGLQRDMLIWALDFQILPDQTELERRADLIASLADDYDYAMIGGAPYFMPYLERALQHEGIAVLYAYSRRESIEETLPDGSVRKTSVFRHVGFVGLE